MARIFSIAFYVIYTVLEVLKYALIIRAVMSWFVSPFNRFYRILQRLTEPMIAPFRPLSMRIAGGRLPIDLSPLFAFFALYLLQSLVTFAQNIVFRAMYF